MSRNTKNSNNDEKSMENELKLIEKIKKILVSKYNYSESKIKTNVKIGKQGSLIDLVVFEDNSPHIVVEIKQGDLKLPLFEHQLKRIMVETQSPYGIMYNGTEKISYQLHETNIRAIKDIPKNTVSKKKTIDEILEDAKKFTVPEIQIPIIADISRRDFYEYTPLIQCLSLKILDETNYAGRLFKNLELKNYDLREIKELFHIGKQNFPNLFSNSRILDENNAKQTIQLFRFIGSHLLLESKTDVISKLILKYTLNKDYANIPDELLEFIFKLLDIEKNKKILFPYATQGHIFQVAELVKKKFKLEQKDLEKYMKKCFSGIEINSKNAEILQIIGMLTKKPVNIINDDFLNLESKLEEFDYFICDPPLGKIIDSQRFSSKFSYQGKEAINYIFEKLRLKENTESKIVIFVPPSFLVADNKNGLRLSFAHPGYLRGIIQLPAGIFFPLSGIPMTMILIDFKPDDSIPNWNNVFLSQIPSSNNREQKLDEKVLNQVLRNYEKFKKGDNFEQTSVSFAVHQNKLIKSWTVADKIPELQKIIEIQSGVRLETVGKIWYGKPGSIEKQTSVPVPYLRISDIQNGSINKKNIKTVLINEDPVTSDILIQENDVLLSCQGTIGKTALARKIDVGSLPSPQIAVIRINSKKILPEYLVQILGSEIVKEQLVKMSTGSTIPRINLDSLANVVIPVPPLTEQRRIADKFQITQKKIKELEKQLEHEKRKLLRFDFGDPSD